MNDAVKKALTESQEATKKSREEAAERLKGKPTPTQDEIDRTRLGEHVTSKDDDGSGPEPVFTRQVESKKPSAAPAGYSTRTANPSPARAKSE